MLIFARPTPTLGRYSISCRMASPTPTLGCYWRYYYLATLLQSRDCHTWLVLFVSILRMSTHRTKIHCMHVLYLTRQVYHLHGSSFPGGNFFCQKSSGGLELRSPPPGPQWSHGTPEGNGTPEGSTPGYL